MSERDSRIDPRPGDVLQGNVSGKTRVKTITAVTELMGGYVVVRSVLENGRNSSSWIEGWRKWAAGATVISQAEEQERG